MDNRPVHHPSIFHFNRRIPRKSYLTLRQVATCRIKGIFKKKGMIFFAEGFQIFFLNMQENIHLLIPIYNQETKKQKQKQKQKEEHRT